MPVLGVLLARVMLWIDGRLPNTPQSPWFFFTGSASDARMILLSLAGIILGTVSVVYSLLTVPLSVAASQFGSRLLRLYLRDQKTQFILGIFVGTFVYLLSVALGIPSAEVNPDTPQLSASLGLLLSLIAFGSIIVLVHHIGTSLQAPNMIASASSDLERIIEILNTESKRQSMVDPRSNGSSIPSPEAEPGCPIYSKRKGYIQYIDPDLVLPLAIEYDLTIHLIRKSGHFIQPGDLIAYAYPQTNVNPETAAQISSAYKLGNHRTPEQDLEYAVNQLVEVAVRAMSPAINDPFTAITCLDHIGAGLSSFDDNVILQDSSYYDTEGRLRLIFNPVTFTELLDASFNMIRHVSRDNPDVLMAELKAIETIAGRMTRAESLAELLRHVHLVEAECQAGCGIDWDKERIRKRCAGLALHLENKLALSSQSEASL
jgi:uncharacterized membrane protein